MRRPSRRGLLASLGASSLALLTAGCVDPRTALAGRHHRSELFVDSDATVDLTPTVTVELADGSTPFDRRVAVGADDSRTFTEALPREGADPATADVTVTLDTGSTASRTVDADSGLHRLWVVLESRETVTIRREVH
ncbi:hypothetical protein N0B31_12320 [Salinirubellus salinus]|uniref:Uncharacterized protein n=1 Tax=Salinirubellus salinus TaxID=1364945 RepID=A0A9E7QZK0_9EURY|nr:hypothetical protein [Salinirubellus salinus]UWM52934.1 hypothetical protein N0B31_12320 [Salinirubellus salinus]